MAPNGASKRVQVSSVVPRIIPAIPHALNKNIRDKQPQRAPSAKLADKATETLAVHKEASDRDAESKPVATHVELAASVSEDDKTSQAAASKVDTTEDDTVLAAAVTTTPPLADSILVTGLETNGVKEIEASTSPSAGGPVENVAQSPLAQSTSAQSPSGQRPVRDLPPSFFPSNQQSGPPSASSAQLRQDQPPASQAAHQPRPSANSLTFGGYRDSANSSPALVPPQPPNPPYSGYSGPPQGHSTYGSHAYHMSDPHAGQLYPPPFSPGPHPYHYPRDYSNNVASYPPRGYHQPAARLQQPPRRPFDRSFDPHMSHRYPPPHVQNTYFPQQQPPRPADTYNESPKVVNPDISSARPNFVLNRFAEQQSGPPASPSGTRQSESPVAPRLDSSPMTQYIRGQFGNDEFTDYVVQLSHSGYSFPPTMLPAHGVILARSPKLKSLIKMQHSDSSNGQNSPKQLNVPISDRFLNFENALMKALMRLYGEPLPDREAVARLAASSAYLEAGSVQAVQMRFALAFAAAGHFLQLDEIISHGLHLAESLLGWDTIGKALAFGLEGGLSLHFSQYETPNKDKGSNSSVDDTPTKLDSPSSAPAYGYYSDRILSYTANFLVYNCPPDFILSPGAPQMNDPPRLPADAEPKHSRSTSKLSRIRFGDMTLDGSNSIDPASEKMSSVLLSLPFPLLRHVLESNILGDRLGWNRVAEITRDAVQEREVRRQRAMKNQGTSAPASAVEERLWRTVRWIESVEPDEQRPTGIKLTRHLAGSETPPSASSVTT